MVRLSIFEKLVFNRTGHGQWVAIHFQQLLKVGRYRSFNLTQLPGAI